MMERTEKSVLFQKEEAAMARIAIVTGASSGLGREYVRQLGEDASIEEFWVIARRKQRLLELQDSCRQKVVPLALDLCDPSSMEVLQQKLEEEKPQIRVLVNAAGLGTIGSSKDLSVAQNDRMIELNVRAAVDVTTICLPYLHKGSRVLEIASIAGFQPMPYFNVYAASKAFLQSYTKGLHYELIGTGIHVTAVCPYWVKDTEFIPNAEKGETKKRYGTRFLASVSRNVVKTSLRDSRLNLWVSTPGIVCTVERVFAKFVPHCIVVPVMDLVSRLSTTHV